MNLRIIEVDGASTTNGGAVITGDRVSPPGAATTAYFPAQSGHAYWDFYYDVMPDYQGGPAVILGNVVRLGGNALVLAVFTIVASLMLQNRRVNRLVAKRTQELLQATRAAEAANAAKSDFLARMSHEIRTPLNAVAGLTKMVLKSDLTAEQRDYLDKVRTASNYLAGVINEILDFSKVEAGRLELEHIGFDLDQVMEQLADLFGDRLGAKDLELIVSVAPSVPRQLAGDADRLIQML
ncbi:MAG: histidine kinase dimerization/phospho-acceptor domain-containing protein, partial [Anaerolineales bacterium]